MATAKKVTFTFGDNQYQAYWNGKEYGQGKVYFSATRVGGTYEMKGSYSKRQESFIDFKAGELDLDSGMISLTVQGRISSVTWLERPPYNAKKVKGQKYFQYELEVSVGLAEQIQRDLEEVEKVWANETPLYEREEPHPAYAGIAAAFKKNPKLQNQLQVGSCYFGHELIDNDECQEFAEVQIQKTIDRLESLRKFSLQKEVEHILTEVQKRGGEAYAEYKPRLQELAKI